MKVVLIPTLICMTCVSGLASLFALLEGNSGFGVLFLMSACLAGLGLWLCVKEKL